MKKNLVMGAVSGYDFSLIRPFVVSLRKTGFAGDICLFASGITDRTRHYLQLLDVQVVTLPQEEQFSGMAISITRFMLYQAFLARQDMDYEGVMLTDVRDVLFQLDPFAFDLSGKVCCFLEAEEKRIIDCPMNSEWLRSKFGNTVLAGIGHNPISCVGTIIGGQPQVQAYLKALLEYLTPPFTIPGDDTAVHNYLIYMRQIPEVAIFANEDGPVITVGYKSADTLSFDGSGLLLNAAGKIVNTIHQYDRHPQLSEKLSFLYA